MNDLNGLDWSVPLSNTNKVVACTGNYYSAFGSTFPPHQSKGTKPLISQSSGLWKSTQKISAAPNTTTIDSFSNLVSFGSGKQTPLTLQEQQEKLIQQKKRLEFEQKKNYESKFGNDQFWNQFESGGSAKPSTPPSISQASIPTPKSFLTHTGRSISPPAVNGRGIVGFGPDKELFAAFKSETEVDRSSHYPPPSTSNEERQSYPLDTRHLQNLGRSEACELSRAFDDLGYDDDDDPFGLSQLKPHHSKLTIGETSSNDDDFLGDLGKPIDEVKWTRSNIPDPVPPLKPETESDSLWDQRVKELTEMGFSEENSRRALIESGSSLDIQAAVSWILNNAHLQAKRNHPNKNISCKNSAVKEEGKYSSSDALGFPERNDLNSRLTNGEQDISKTAASMGSNLFKTANSIWKTSQKKVQKVVAELQQPESDPQQPKWMRESTDQELAWKKSITEGRGSSSNSLAITDEALVLETTARPSQTKIRTNEKLPPAKALRDPSRVIPKLTPQERTHSPRWQSPSIQGNRTKFERERSEASSEPVYVSPVRRKKITPQFSEKIRSASSATPYPSPPPSTSQKSSVIIPSRSSPSTNISSRNKAPPRNLPYLSPTALQSSTEFRLAGTSFFKRGDYASAHNSYTNSLSVLPPSHPISIILLCNRALTSLKTGVPKSAVSDANMALKIIGDSHGAGETINLGTGQGGIREMKEYYGKALMRKAEALEQMEKWKDAGEIWKLCVEEGIGGSTAIQGRSRCQNSLLPRSAPQIRSPHNANNSKPTPKSRVVITDNSAVSRLRQANEKAEKVDDEKFALSDKVDAHIGAWRDGKKDNLRALLGSLDAIMWEGSGWKKVGMHELVQNNKVKLHYLKAIGKTHPDKLPQDASTEVRMIAAMVFATLNESWDKFKQTNGI